SDMDGAGMLGYVIQSEHEAERGDQQQRVAIWRELGDDARTASCLGDLGAAAHIRGESPAAQAMYGEALGLARRVGALNIMARCLSGLGRLALHTNDLDRATADYTESMARVREAGE